MNILWEMIYNSPKSQVFYLCKPTPQYPKVGIKGILEKSTTNLTGSFILATLL